MCFRTSARRTPAILFAAVLMGALPLSGCSKDKPVATVNGSPITSSEFSRRCETFVPDPQRQQGMSVSLQVLEDLLRQKALEQEVDKLGALPSKEDVDRRFAAMKKQMDFFETPLEQRLRMEGRTEEDFKREIRDSMLVERFFLHDTNVTDEEARKFYEQNKSNPQWSLPERIRISTIGVTTPDRLKKALADLRSNASFRTVAAAYSEDGSQATNGEIQRWFTRSDLTSGANLPVPLPVVSKAFAMKPGEYSDPAVQVILGDPASKKSAWVIVKLDEKKPAQSLSFEDVKELAQQAVRFQKAQSRSAEKQKAYTSILKDAEIEVNRPEWEDFIKQFKAIAEQRAAQAAQGAPGGPVVPPAGPGGP